ncbi:hypothetical protein INT48_001120 [Thamnidium elegans]|uniref:TPR-like protein n=1 Tax=Thamnidium elegans TaxID=101142 RepID=A0A8H7SPH9_9FUNG|nr:hypothetical protein INT48_001120 [Thamnidium elegans]
MNSKANLKAAREAIGTKNFGEAVKACKRILLWEGENYNAWVFLGVAYTGLEDDEEAEAAYKRAIEINDENMLGWQGLVSFYEKRNKKVELAKTIQQLIPRFVASGDGAKLAAYLKKLLQVYKDTEPEKHFETLKLFLSGSEYYELIKDQPDLPPQIDIWKLVIEKLDKEQAAKIDSEVASRRFRVSAGTPAQVRDQVEAEIYSVSKLGIMYQNVLDLIPEQDQQERQVWKLKLLTFYSKRLMGAKDKAELYQKVMDLARELIDANDPLPLQLLIESANVDSPDKYDWDLFNQLIQRFPETGLAKLGRGYQLSKQGNLDEAFDLFGEGLDACPNSLFGYQCLCWIYYESKEFETGLEYATKGKDIVTKVKLETGISMSNVLLSLELCMAHCYRLLDKKYHIDAMALYKTILQHYPQHTGALEGLGLILIEEKRLDEALGYFQKVHQLDPQNHPSVAEIGWIYCEQKNYTEAIECIEKALMIAGKDVADYYYRLGRVYWFMEDSSNAFKYFMQSVKLDPYFATGFTFLGHYYREIKQDHARAKKCYQKAYILNPLDTDAALYLSDYLTAENKQDEAEAIFVQVSESSPKVGWAWRRLGYINMNTSSYNQAIVCFQKALRTDTSDVRCWEGLAEAYSRAGRFVAALKAFGRATNLDPTSVHASNEQAYVQQKVGLLDEAIAGFKHTLQLAKDQRHMNYVPALVGLAETYLERAKEDFQQGFFGRASDGCNLTLDTCLLGLQQDASMLSFWKFVGDACAFYRQIPKYLNNMDYLKLQQVMQLANLKAHDQLKFTADITSHWLGELLELDQGQLADEDFTLPHKTALDVILSCAAHAYKQAIVICRNHQSIAPAFWHDLAIIYYHLSLNANQEEAMVAIKCCKVALKLEPTQYLYWNSLGVIAMLVADLPKLAQYAFVKAMEFNNRSAIPWTNYGFLCLSLKDYELANQAFEMAHSLDPEWISAWVGQAYVASLWGTDAAAIFEHAFESSNGSAMDASYGYADTIFNGLATTHDTSTIITPVFALEKLTEQKLHDALALNLLGLLLERLGQYDRAAESFASAILAVEAQLEESQITAEEGNTRLCKIHSNLGRTLCAVGDFEGAIHSYQVVADAHNVYAQLNAGIAYYFQDKLSESLALFELALDATQHDIQLRQDVIVLLSKVLWALGGEEQRSVAKDQLFSSITDNPNYLPAIFSLCVMGMLQDDETLTAAALQELAKVSVDIASKPIIDESDREQSISYLFSKFYEIQGNQIQATRALVKSVHQTPWLALVWARLSSHLVNSALGDDLTNTMTSSTLVMSLNKSRTANAQSEAYQNAALAQRAKYPIASYKCAQRSVISAPWRLSAWQCLTPK